MPVKRRDLPAFPGRVQRCQRLAPVCLRDNSGRLNTRLMSLFLVQTSLNDDPSLLNARLMGLSGGLG
jgi:hypothetical protein